MPKSSKKTCAKRVVRTEMHKFKTGTLHSGSKKGPLVKKRKKAVAISLNVARKKCGGDAVPRQ